VAGYVAALHVADNQFVKAGQLLLEIDPRDYQVALEQAQAAAASAAGRLKEAEAQVAAAEAQAVAGRADVAAAEATTQNAQQDLARYRSLTPRGAASQQSLDSAVATAHASAAQQAAEQAKVASAESQILLAKAHQSAARGDMAEAEAQVLQARLNLSYTKIEAPISGRVTRRTVELGDYLKIGQPLFALVDPHVWVTANFKETQLTHMHVGQLALVRVDAFPSRRLKAHLDSFQRGTGARFSVLPAENATGNYVKVVQRVPVKIVFDESPPAEMILGPGMSVVPRVTVR
jgi:membrane fusion protein (multidrug efflux system)